MSLTDRRIVHENCKKFLGHDPTSEQRSTVKTDKKCSDKKMKKKQNFSNKSKIEDDKNPKSGQKKKKDVKKDKKKSNDKNDEEIVRKMKKSNIEKPSLMEKIMNNFQPDFIIVNEKASGRFGVQSKIGKRKNEEINITS